MTDIDDLQLSVRLLSERVNRLEAELMKVKRTADNAEYGHIRIGNY